MQDDIPIRHHTPTVGEAKGLTTGETLQDRLELSEIRDIDEGGFLIRAVEESLVIYA